MDLSRSTQDGLQLYSDTSFSDADYKTFLQATFASLVHRKADGKEVKDEKTPEALQNSLAGKQAYAATATFVLEAAKTDAAASEIAGVLEDAKVAEPRIKFFVALFEQFKPSLRSTLAATSLSFPSVVGFKWRMDQYLKSAALEAIRQPVYFLQLKTQQPDGSTKEVEFAADFNELQDLLFKLKDAQNQVVKKVLV